MLCYAMLSHFSRVRLCVTPQMVAYQAPPSLGFSRQEHWSGLPLPLQCRKVKSESEVAWLCLTLRDPMDCSLPGSSIHGIFQARVLEGLPLPSPNSHDAGLSPCNSDQVIPADSPCLGANIMIRLTHLLFLHLQLQIQSPQSNTQYYVGSLLYQFSSFALSNTSHLYKC